MGQKIGNPSANDLLELLRERIVLLNGVTPGGWVDYAKGMQQAGADAMELNFYDLPTDPEDSALDVETRALDILQAVKENVTIPVAVKLSPFFSSLPNFASELVATGANGLIFSTAFTSPTSREVLK